MSRVSYTTHAQQDILDITFYIAQHNVTAAHRLLQKILNTCEKLGASPQAGRLRGEIAPNIRSFPLDKYLIFYRPVRGGIEIVRVLHGARDIPALW